MTRWVQAFKLAKHSASLFTHGLKPREKVTIEPTINQSLPCSCGRCFPEYRLHAQGVNQTNIMPTTSCLMILSLNMVHMFRGDVIGRLFDGVAAKPVLWCVTCLSHSNQTINLEFPLTTVFTHSHTMPGAETVPPAALMEQTHSLAVE